MSRLTPAQKHILELMRSKPYGLGAESAAILRYEATRQPGERAWCQLHPRLRSIRKAGAAKAIERLVELGLAKPVEPGWDGTQYKVVNE